MKKESILFLFLVILLVIQISYVSASEKYLVGKNDELVIPLYCNDGDVVVGVQRTNDAWVGKVPTKIWCQDKDINANTNHRRELNSWEKGGSMFCSKNEVVCGFKKDARYRNAFNEMYCCYADGKLVNLSSKRLVYADKDLLCEEDEVVCGARNRQDTARIVEKIWCCEYEKETNPPNCNDRTENDKDGDGFIDLSCGGNDCDDDNSSINPNAAEICGNGIDEDCDGLIDETCSPPEENEIINRCSDASQIILRLSELSNAHGEVWDGDGNYPVEICYDEIFGQVYNGANPHSCSATNKVVGLSAETNAHAEYPSLNNYDVDVCYGDLECRSDLTPAGCEALGGEIVVTLSSNTNAHLAKGVFYDKEICCKKSAEEEIYWANMFGIPIGKDYGIKAQLGDSVKLILSGAGNEGESVDFEIYEKDILPVDDFIRAITATVNSEGDAVGVWTITQEDLEKTDDLDDFVFITDEKESNELEIEGSGENSAPVAEISSPKDLQIYFLGEELEFSQESYDEDDSFSYVWNLGEGVTKAGNSNNLENYEFLYSYLTPGQKNIILEITDSRGKKAIDRASILIVNSDYVMSYITEPKWGESFNRQVRFNATESYAVSSEIINNIRRMTCLAGKCPEKTEGCPPGSSVPYPGCQVIIENTPNWEGFENLKFNWTFDNTLKFEGEGREDAEFTKLFDKAGKHTAKLKVSLNPSSETSTEFNVYFNKPVCDIYSEVAGWWEDSSFSAWYEPDYDCYREDVEFGLNDCCPAEASNCNRNTGNCEEGAEHCCDYDEEDCGDNNAVAVEDLNPILERKGYECRMVRTYGTKCEEKIDCFCDWNETSCKAVSEHLICKGATCYEYEGLPSNIEGICGTEFTPTSGKCSIVFDIVDECNSTGKIYREWVADWSGEEETKPEYCNDGNDSTPCVSGALLGFFDTANFIIAIILIAIFYVIVIRNKKKYKKKRKQRVKHDKNRFLK